MCFFFLNHLKKGKSLRLRNILENQIKRVEKYFEKPKKAEEHFEKPKIHLKKEF